MLESGDAGKALKEYFAPVFTKKKDMEDNEIGVENAKMQGQFEIKAEEVFGLLKSINVDKSPGSDMIYSRLLRETK